MKFTVQKSALMEKLSPAMGSVSTQNTITSIEGILLETVEDGKIRLSTYDMNKGVRALVDAVSIERPGSFIVNAKRFYSTLRVLPDDDITVDVNDKLNMTVSSGKSSFSMFVLAGQDFPNLPELLSDEGFVINSRLLRSMIDRVMHSVAVADTRAMLCGAFFKIRGNTIDAVSCDSYTLSIRHEVSEIPRIGGENDYSFIIPGHALGEIVRLLADAGEEDTVDFYLSRKHAILRKEDIVFFTRTIESDYIDYERIMPKENDNIVVLDRERLLTGLERANLIAEEKVQGSGRSYVKLRLDGQKLTLTSSSVNGKVYDEMDCVHEGPELEIGFNCRYLINCVRAATGESLRLSFKNATSAVVMEPVEKDENSNFFYMVLPVRMANNNNE